MATDQNRPPSRRPHYHRGRRGHDRRGPAERRPTQSAEPRRDSVDVEQIMREIRSRIAERGVELSPQQIQELAARRLEAVLDPTILKPSLMDELRRAAGMPIETTPVESDAAAPPAETTLWEASNPLLRFLRRIFRPFLTLLISPTALAEALNAQTRAARASALRDQEQQRRQAEWNGLHYEILRRLVTDIARAEVDARDLALRVESLAAKVDFNERRVRGLEQALHQAKSVPRVADSPATPASRPIAETQAQQSSPEGGTESARRRRRRRRGRRTGLGAPSDTGAAPATASTDAVGDDTETVSSGTETSMLADEDTAFEERDSEDSDTEDSDTSAPSLETAPPATTEPPPASGEPVPDPSPVEQDLFERPSRPESDQE